MTAREIDVLVGRLDGIDDRLKEQGSQLGRIEDHAETTNGRVTKVEDNVTGLLLWRARMDGAKWALSWVPPLITGVIVAAVSVSAALILG